MREHFAERNDIDISDTRRSAGTHTTVASFAAVASALAASGCCLPVVPFVIAAGFAGGSTVLSAARPYLLGVSILLIAYGFYQARRAKKCRRRLSAVNLILLWVSTAFVAISIFLPQLFANAAANLFAR
jgi:hypothetical protein